MHAVSLVVSDFTFVKRHSISTHEEYWSEIDEYQRPDGSQLLLGHLRFSRFSASIMKRFMREWFTFRSVVTAPIFVYSEDGTDKFERFITRLGFQPLDTEIVCNNGERRSLFISIVKDTSLDVRRSDRKSN